MIVTVAVAAVAGVLNELEPGPFPSSPVKLTNSTRGVPAAFATYPENDTVPEVQERVVVVGVQMIASAGFQSAAQRGLRMVTTWHQPSRGRCAPGCEVRRAAPGGVSPNEGGGEVSAQVQPSESCSRRHLTSAKRNTAMQTMLTPTRISAATRYIEALTPDVSNQCRSPLRELLSDGRSTPRTVGELDLSRGEVCSAPRRPAQREIVALGERSPAFAPTGAASGCARAGATWSG